MLGGLDRGCIILWINVELKKDFWSVDDNDIECYLIIVLMGYIIIVINNYCLFFFLCKFVVLKY